MRFLLLIISLVLIIYLCENEVFGATLLVKRMADPGRVVEEKDTDSAPKKAKSPSKPAKSTSKSSKSTSKSAKCEDVTCSPAPKDKGCKVSKNKPITHFDDMAECCPVYDCKNKDGSTFSHYGATGSKSSATGSSHRFEFGKKIGDGDNGFQFKGYTSMGSGSEADKEWQKNMPKFEVKPWDFYMPHMRPWDVNVPRYDWGFPNYAAMYGGGYGGGFFKQK